MSEPRTFMDRIAEAVIRAEYERRLVRPGHINVSDDLMGVLIDEMRDRNRYLMPVTDSVQGHPMQICGWPVHPVGDMKPLQWSIVPP